MSMDKMLENIALKNTATQKFFYIIILLIISVSWFGIFDDFSLDFLNDSLIDAGIAFGSARLVNATISVIQSITLDFPVIETGIGQVVDPINDLVEQYSSMMMLAIGSLVVQKLLLEIISDLIFKIALTASGLLLIAAWVRGNISMLKPLFKIFVSLVFLRFLLVLVVLLNGVVDRIFIEPQMQEDLATIENYSSELQAIKQQSGLSSELREELETQIKTLESERALLEDAIDPNSKKLQEIEVSISEIELEIQEVVSELSATERYNIFNKDEELKHLQESLDTETETAESLETELEAAAEKIEEINQSIDVAQKTLAGESTGLLSSISNRVASLSQSLGDLRHQLSPSVLMGDATVFAESVVRTMTLFIFRTLILPLLFLYLLVKGLKSVWNVDLQDMYQKQLIAQKQSKFTKSEQADVDAAI